MSDVMQHLDQMAAAARDTGPQIQLSAVEAQMLVDMAEIGLTMMRGLFGDPAKSTQVATELCRDYVKARVRKLGECPREIAVTATAGITGIAMAVKARAADAIKDWRKAAGGAR